ncbi:MAG: metallophosphoesterase [Myxococcota bacterium]
MEAVAIANREKPDLVVLTGDFVCHSHAWLENLTEVLRGLDAPTFAVLGNHDYWAGAQGVRVALRRAGVELLSNANTQINVRGERLQLVGLDDAYTGHADRRKAIRGMSSDIATLGLSHIAEEADGLWEAGVPFVLSGHTHGGQLTVARLNELTLGRFGGHRYVHGLYGQRKHEQGGAVYVSAGIGAAVMPFRVGDRGNREVALFELGARPGDLEHPEHHEEQEALNPASTVPHDVQQARARAFQAAQAPLPLAARLTSLQNAGSRPRRSGIRRRAIAQHRPSRGSRCGAPGGGRASARGSGSWASTKAPTEPSAAKRARRTRSTVLLAGASLAAADDEDAVFVEGRRVLGGSVMLPQASQPVGSPPIGVGGLQRRWPRWARCRGRSLEEVDAIVVHDAGVVAALAGQGQSRAPRRARRRRVGHQHGVDRLLVGAAAAADDHDAVTGMRGRVHADLGRQRRGGRGSGGRRRRRCRAARLVGGAGALIVLGDAGHHPHAVAQRGTCPANATGAGSGASSSHAPSMPSPPISARRTWS